MEPNNRANALSREIIGAAIEVHRALGPGFLERLYEEALAIELQERSIAFVRQKRVRVSYKKRHIGEGRIDFLVADAVIVELKSIERFAPIHEAQMISYLKMTGHQVGLLINFNVVLLKSGIRRIVHTRG